MTRCFLCGAQRRSVQALGVLVVRVFTSVRGMRWVCRSLDAFGARGPPKDYDGPGCGKHTYRTIVMGATIYCARAQLCGIVFLLQLTRKRRLAACCSQGLVGSLILLAVCMYCLCRQFLFFVCTPLVRASRVEEFFSSIGSHCSCALFHPGWTSLSYVCISFLADGA